MDGLENSDRKDFFHFVAGVLGLKGKVRSLLGPGKGTSGGGGPTSHAG